MHNRFISFFIATLIALQSISLITAVSEENIAVTSGSFNIGGATVTHNQTLTDNQNGTYTLEIALSSSYRYEDSNVHPQVSKNGYFKAERAGDYLVELWGGDGADGIATRYGEGGKGGAGGHIYGTVHLEAGDVLYYTAGGDGAATLSTDEGGGVNGDGGNHGDTGSYTVGGGGGYSAVFKFSEEEFSKYISTGDTEPVISETDRVTNYIMIAGGGGGGGAGNGFSLFAQSGSADGGNGGSIGGVSGILSGEYDVEGTFYAGGNGRSSGSSAAYIGHGGTNLPGTISDTLLTLFEGEEPNDWRGTYNPNQPGGAGGNGNLRGGAGGAGFCGGSGGVMTSLVTATNVGGGGGGSSFVADTVNIALSEDEKSLLLGTNPSETGGSISITYLVEDDFSFLDDLNFTFTASKYFNIVGEPSCEGGNISEVTNEYIRITGASVRPNDDGSASAPLKIKVYLMPKDGFAGGNSVPLTESFVCDSAGHGSADIELGDKCSYANVPLNFEIIARSFTTNAPNTPCPVTNFYTDRYAGIRDNLGSYTNYDFISEIGQYTVTDLGGAPVGDTVANAETTRYNVSFRVIPKEIPPAAVGEPVTAKTYSAPAVYQVVAPGEGMLNGNKLIYGKALSFDEESGLYRLDLTVDSATDTTLLPVDAPHYAYYGMGTRSYTVPEDGYYLLQAWGGKGGDGKHWLTYAPASYGGDGGYVDGFVHLNKGDIIQIDRIGANGKDGNRDSLPWFAPGRGGNYTKISVSKDSGTTYQPLLIAGGGGGGGRKGPSSTAYDGKDGATGAEPTSDPPNSDESIYNGQDGGNAENNTPDGQGGLAGQNYKSILMDVEDSEHPLYENGRETIENAGYSQYTNNGSGGAAYITCVQTDRIDNAESMHEGELSDYTLEAAVSQYFDFVSLEGKNNKETAALEMGEYTFENGLVTIPSVNPAVTSVQEAPPDGEGLIITGSVSFTVSLYFRPKDGFLGGNDVPLLNNAGAAGLTGMRLSQPQKVEGTVDTVSEIPPVDPADYANVAIPRSTAPDDLVTFEKTYTRGGEGVYMSELYQWNGRPVTEFDWQDDFVNIIEPKEELLTPQITTRYPVTVGIEPKKGPEKASVISSAEAVTADGEGVIFVATQIIYNLTHLTTDDIPDEDGIYSAHTDRDYTALLTAEDGYELPESISVTDQAGTPLAHSYDRETGELSIPVKSLGSTVVITAGGEEHLYTLTFIYELSPGGVTRQKEYTVRAGSALPRTDDVYAPEEVYGYEFIWDWGDGQTEPPETMPARDLWVTGTYIPLDFTVTVNFLHRDGSPVEAEENPMTITGPYGSEYQVLAPAVPGYLPETPVISGTVDGNKEIDIYYDPTENSLNIFYFLRDDPERPTLYKVYSENVATGEHYRIETEEITGYTPTPEEVIEGDMTAEGATYYVYYDPNEYTVFFDADGGACDTESKKVVYRNPYGYNPDGSYSALPTPIKVGYIFEGWYLGDELITEASVVETAGDHTLTAKWGKITSTLTIKYRFEDGTPAAEDAVRELAFGESFSIPSPEIRGYTADRTTVSGTMPANNTVIEVYYTANEYTLTVHYVYYESGEKAADDFTGRFKYLEEYSVPSPEIPNYSYTEVLNGIMGAEDFETTVYYYQNAPTVSVTVSWGDLNYIYTHGEWDPETHTYEQHPIKPETPGRNTVTVSSSADSDIPIDAVFGYIPAAGYENLGAYYTAGASDAERLQQITVRPGGESTSYIWLEGRLARSVTEPFAAGVCTVTIKGGGN